MISSFPGLYFEKYFFDEGRYHHIIRHRRGRYQRNQDVPDDKKEQENCQTKNEKHKGIK